MTFSKRTEPTNTGASRANSATTRGESTTKSFGKFQIPAHWKVDETSAESQTKYAIIGNPFPKPKRP
jgi:hypothetical protein